MAAKQEIQILITPEGEVKLEVKGMKGSGCLLEIKRLADQLGQMKSQDLAPEYYEKPTEEQVQKKQTGS